ncbi:MAG: hypothetical protein WA883_11170 [Phormidesmis sp.]
MADIESLPILSNLIESPDLTILLAFTETLSPVEAKPINSQADFGSVASEFGGGFWTLGGGFWTFGAELDDGTMIDGSDADEPKVAEFGVDGVGVGVEAVMDGVGVGVDVEGSPINPTSFNPRINAVIAPITPANPVKTPGNVIQKPPLC